MLILCMCFHYELEAVFQHHSMSMLCSSVVHSGFGVYAPQSAVDLERKQPHPSASSHSTSIATHIVHASELENATAKTTSALIFWASRNFIIARINQPPQFCFIFFNILTQL